MRQLVMIVKKSWTLGSFDQRSLLISIADQKVWKFLRLENHESFDSFVQKVRIAIFNYIKLKISSKLIVRKVVFDERIFSLN